MNLVWKHLVRGPRAGKMHCTSTTMASQAPVSTTFSCCRKLPAMGMPWRMATSLAVQHTPADVDALGAHVLGQGDHLGILRVEHDHLRQRGVVAVDNDVDHVLLHDAEVGGGVHGLGGAEQDVGQLGAASWIRPSRRTGRRAGTGGSEPRAGRSSPYGSCAGTGRPHGRWRGARCPRRCQSFWAYFRGAA